MPQLRMYTGKILRATVDAKEIHKFIRDNELKIKDAPNEIIRIRIYSFQIGIPPDAPKPSNLDIDLLNHGDPIALLNIYVNDLIKFGSYTRLEPKNGYTILSNLYDEKIERIQTDPFKPILPIRHYFAKIKSILLNPIVLTVVGIIIGIIGIMVTIAVK